MNLAFISYKHSETNRKAAIAIDSALRKYGRPVFQWPPSIFRDEQKLTPNSDLTSTIRKALKDSTFLIYLASAEAAGSPWVCDELRYWCQDLGRADRLIIVLIADQISVDKGNDTLIWETSPALPLLLKDFIRIPFYIDLTWAEDFSLLDLSNARFRALINEISARLRNVTPEQMSDDEVRTARRNRLWLRLGIASLALMTILSLSAAFYANKQRSLAEAREATAVSNLLISQSTLALSKDPSEALAEALLAWSKDPTNTETHLAVLKAYYQPDAFPALIANAGETTFDTTDSWFSASFSPDSQRILSIDLRSPKRLHLFDLRGNDNPLNLPVPAKTAVLSPNGKYFLTTGASMAVLWDLAGSKLQQFFHPRITSAAFSPDSSRIVTAGDDNMAVVWNIKGEVLARLRGHTNYVDSAKFSPDGKLIVTAGDTTARLWTTEGSLLKIFRHPDYVTGASFSPDGELIATTCWDGLPRLWWRASGDLAKSYKGHSGRTFSPSFSPDGEYLATASWDGTVRVWWGTTNLVNEAIKILPSRFKDGFNSVSWSPDGRWLATTGGKLLDIWDVKTQRYLSLKDRTIEQLKMNQRWGPFEIRGYYRYVTVFRSGTPFYDFKIEFSDHMYAGGFSQDHDYVDTDAEIRFPFSPKVIQRLVFSDHRFGFLSEKPIRRPLADHESEWSADD